MVVDTMFQHFICWLGYSAIKNLFRTSGRLLAPGSMLMFIRLTVVHRHGMY